LHLRDEGAWGCDVTPRYTEQWMRANDADDDACAAAPRAHIPIPLTPSGVAPVAIDDMPKNGAVPGTAHDTHTTSKLEGHREAHTP